MAFLTKDDVRQSARARIQRSASRTAKQILSESVRTATSQDRFDVFLSHSSEDAEIVLGVREVLIGLGLTVYVDWIDDAQLGRESVTAENADVLRVRMRSSKSMVFLTTKNSVSSKWMPWELGFFDGMRNGFIGILPIVDSAGATFSGQEYLGLYPLVERLPLADGSGSRLCVVELARRGYRFLESFSRGDSTIQAFSRN